MYYVYRDFPLDSIHPGARQAADATRCAAEQGKFWDMHKRVFAGQDAGEWSDGGPGDLETFVSYAAELGIDGAALQQCVESPKYDAAIEGDLQEGVQKGVRGTPAFLINGELISGARPIGNWREILDSILAQS